MKKIVLFLIVASVVFAQATYSNGSHNFSDTGAGIFVELVASFVLWLYSTIFDKK